MKSCKRPISIVLAGHACPAQPASSALDATPAQRAPAEQFPRKPKKYSIPLVLAAAALALPLTNVSAQPADGAQADTAQAAPTPTEQTASTSTNWKKDLVMRHAGLLSPVLSDNFNDILLYGNRTEPLTTNQQLGVDEIKHPPGAAVELGLSYDEENRLRDSFRFSDKDEKVAASLMLHPTDIATTYVSIAEKGATGDQKLVRLSFATFGVELQVCHGDPETKERPSCSGKTVTRGFSDLTQASITSHAELMRSDYREQKALRAAAENAPK